jgi:hypothetical protein
MADTDAIVAKFTPQFEGAFLRGVPQRDLTQADLDRLDPLTRRDALAPHPGFGTPLYTIVEKGKEQTAQERAITAAEKAADKKDGDA